MLFFLHRVKKLLHNEPETMLFGRGLGSVGFTIGSSPIVFLCISLVLGAISTSFLYFKDIGSRLNFDEGYTSVDAPSIRELQAQVDFFGNLGKPWYMGLFAEPRNGSMTNSKEFWEFTSFYKHIKENLVIKHQTARNYTYMDYCAPMCTFNDVLFKTYAMSFFGFEWPVTWIFGYQSNIGKYFFERTMDGSTLTGSKLQALYFMVFLNSTQAETDMKQYELLVADAVKTHNADPTKKTTITQHSAVGMEAEIEKGITTAVMYFALGLAAMALCVAVCLLISSRTHKYSCTRSLAMFFPVIILPIISLASAAGIHNILGNHFNVPMLFTPIAAFGFGLDGMFVIYNQWLSAHNKRIYDQNNSQLQEVFAECVPTIFISALTSVVLLFGKLFPIEEYAQISFFVGLIIMATLVFQLFFFVPLMLLMTPVQTHDELKSDQVSRPTRLGGSHDSLETYAKIITHSTLVKILAAVVFFVLAIFAGIGMNQVKGNLDYRQLLRPESPGNKGVHIMSDIVWPDFLHILFILEKPPKFDDPTEYMQFTRMLDDIQALPGTMDRRDNMMWIDDFNRFAGTKPDATSLNMTRFIPFITDEIYQAWNSGVQYSTVNNTDGTQDITITKMIIMTAFNGTRTMADKAVLMSNCRRVAANYKQFNVIPFDTEVGMVDVVSQGPPVTIILPAAIFLFIVVWFLMFAANLTTAAISALVAAATYFVAYGLSALCCLEINPFAVSALIILGALTPKAVVHIAYYFQLSSTMKKKDPEARLIDTLVKGLLPTVQSTISTSCILIPMLFVPVGIFWNISLLSALFTLVCLYTAVVFLPVVLSFLPKGLTGSGCLYTASY